MRELKKQYPNHEYFMRQNTLHRQEPPFSYPIPPVTPSSIKHAIQDVFPGRHPQERSPLPHEIIEALRRKYPNHEYFAQANIPSDRSMASIGNMLYPDEATANFFPSSANKPIEPVSRAHEKLRSVTVHTQSWSFQFRWYNTCSSEGSRSFMGN